MTTQLVANLTTTRGFVSDDAVRAAFRPPWAPPLHGATGHELGKDHRFMPLARGQQQGEELPGAFSPQVDFGAEASLTPPERFGVGIPF